MAARLFPSATDSALPPSEKHPSGQFQAQVTQIRRAALVKHFERLDDLQGVAHSAAEGLIHVRDQRDDAFAHASAGLDQKISEMRGILFALHKCARANFHVQYQGVDPLCELLAHDGAANQGRALDRARDIAESVELLVGWGDFRCLANEGATASAEHAAEVHEREVDVEARNGLQLVERAAGVTESSAADHRHAQPAGGRDRRQHQRGLVAYAARRVFVYLAAGQIGKIQHLARVHHRVGQSGDLGASHSSPENGHQPGGNLVIGNLVSRITADQGGDFIGRKFATIALATDEIHSTHREGVQEAGG